MKIEIALAKSHFGAGESIAVAVQITNDTASATAIPRPHSNRNWQPTYTIAGPAYPEGKTFSFASAVWGDAAKASADTTTLGPGQSRREDIDLDQLVTLAEPGTYTLKADLLWNGVEAHSPPVSFTIERPAIRSCQLLASPGLGVSTMFPAFCLQRSTTGPGDVQVAIFRLHRQLGTFTRTGLSHYAVAGDGAEAIFAPWLGYTQAPGSPSPRPVYQAGSRLGILRFNETGGSAITLPFSPQVVRPALGVRHGDQDLFVVDNQGKRLALLRFAVTKAARPRIQWTMSLPAQIVSARAALAAPEGGEPRHAVLVADEPAGTQLLLADAGDGAKVLGVHVVKIPNLHARSNSEPGLHIDAKGRARASVVLESPPQPDGSVDVSLAEVTWEARRTDPHVELVALPKLDAPPLASAATYSVSARGGLLAWAMVTASGEVISSSPSGVHRLKGTPTLPLDLLATDTFLALLTFNFTGTPELERL